MIRRLAVLVLTVAGLALGGVAAWGYWGASANAGAAGAAAATTVNAASGPTAAISAARTVSLSWPAVTLANGVAVDGYVVKRYHSSTLVTQTVGGTCAGTVTGTSCAETSVPAGTWRYSVYPRIGVNWLGTESALTSVVTVTTPVLTLARTSFPSALTTTGTVSGFGVNEAISYRLDSSTPLTGFPAVVDTTGGAPISSLIIPATTEGTHTVWVIGANGSQAGTTIVYDSVAPVVSASVSPAAGGTGWNTTSPVSVTLTASDATSGVAAIRYTTDGTDPTVSGSALPYSSPFSLATTTTVRYAATDAAGNTSAVGSRAVKVDTVAPAGSVALAGATGAVLSGSTVWYYGPTAGSFAITNTVSDAGSGPASSATAALGGSTAGFSHTPSTVTTPTGGPYVSTAFAWTAGTTSSPTETVTSADVAGNSTPTTLTFVNDSSPPAGGGVDATGLTGTGSRYSTSTSLTVAFSAGTDGGAGLAAAGAQLLRSTGTLGAGACTGYGGFTPIATDPTSPYTETRPDQACYRYQYVVADKLGNSTTYTSGDIKVDTTAPSAPTLAASALTNTYLSGTTLYYRGSQSSGSVTLTASAADAGSGILSYTMPSGFGLNWTATGGGSGISTYAWSGTPAAPAAQPVTATDNANLSSTTTLTATSDVTAPSGGAVSYTNGWSGTSSVVVTFSTGTDGGSGLGSGVLQRRSAAYTIGTGCAAFAGAWTSIPAATGSPYTDSTVVGMTCYQYQYLMSDNVGNQAAYTSSSVVKVPDYTTCDAAVSAAGPVEYYRLNESAGSTTAADGKSGTPLYPGTYTNVSAWRVGGPCGATNGVSFAAATAGYVSTAQTFTNPTTFSEEVWFSTTATNVRLVGLSQPSVPSSANYDRHLYLNSSGQLVYGAYTALAVYQTITAGGGPYNDGKWHHAAVTQSAANGAKVYLDGLPVGSDSTIKTGQNVTGVWRVGTDGMAGWPGITLLSNYNYAGSLSTAAFYSTELTAAQVFDHYIAGVISSSGPALTTTAGIGVTPLEAPSVPVSPPPSSPGSPPAPPSSAGLPPSAFSARPPDAPTPSN